MSQDTLEGVETSAPVEGAETPAKPAITLASIRTTIKDAKLDASESLALMCDLVSYLGANPRNRRKIKRGELPRELKADQPEVGTVRMQALDTLANHVRLVAAFTGDNEGTVRTGIALAGGGHTVQANVNAAKIAKDGLL